MANCKHCGKKFHACSSCGLRYEEYDFCNNFCYTAYGSPIYDAYGICETLVLNKYCNKCNPDGKLPPTNYEHVHTDEELGDICCICDSSEYVITVKED